MINCQLVTYINYTIILRYVTQVSSFCKFVCTKAVQSRIGFKKKARSNTPSGVPNKTFIYQMSDLIEPLFQDEVPQTQNKGVELHLTSRFLCSPQFLEEYLKTPSR